MILSNRVQCKVCLQVIESRYQHDMVTCNCGNVSVDGGHAYLRRAHTGDNPHDDYTELSVEITVVQK